MNEPNKTDERIEDPSVKADQLAEIERFAAIIKDKRKEAIEARRRSGIEKQWSEDEDHYEGQDSQEGAWEKGRTTIDSPRETRKKTPGRSSAFVNITRPYCDAASARVSDILLPTDDRNWAFRATPKPGLISPQPQQPPQQPLGMFSKIGSAIGGMFNKPAEPMMGDPGQQAIDQAKDSAKRAETVVDDWLVECGYHAEVRECIESAARRGAGILKGPHPTRKKTKAVSQTPDGYKMSIEAKTSPATKYVDLWNFYPDPNCGEYVENGSYTCEREDITAYGLRHLKGGNFIDEMIDMCLDEGPTQSVDGARKNKEGQKTSDKDLFEIWYIYCQVSKKEMEAAGCECSKDGLPAIVTMVNDRVIQITMSPLDSGEFPYDVFVWQKKIGHWAGIGVARQIRTCQKGLNSSVRSLQDNASISSGPQIIFDSSKIEPADGKWTIFPNKLWRKKLGAEDVADVRQAFTIVSIETRQKELMNNINYWTKTAEDVTGLPMLLQGQQGQAPDTLGATQIVNNNGSTVLRRLARGFDDRVTIPHMGRYYEWLLLRGPDDAKGEYQVEARGSSSLVERDLQNRAAMQLLGLSLNPAYMLDPEKTAKETIKGMKLDHKNYALDDEQKKAMKERQPPPPYQVQVAQIREQGQLEREKMESQQVNDRIVAEASMTMEKLKVEVSENEKDRNNKLAVAVIDERMKSTELTSAERQTLNKIKAELAGKSMSLNVQQQLSRESMAQSNDHTTAKHKVDIFKHTTPQVAKPSFEPRGRAPAGQAFVK